MLRTVTALVLALLATIAVASAAVLASAHQGSGQSLGVALSAQGSHVERLDSYAPAQPIAVRVDAPRAETVALLGVTPEGGNLRVPLVRGADGRFGADVRLPVPGVWSLAVSARTDAIESVSDTFAVSVAQGAGAKALGVVMALAVALLAGGIALIVLGLVRARRRPVALAE